MSSELEKKLLPILCCRTKPLFDLEGDMAEALKDFEGKFERGEIAGWAKEQQGAMAHTGAHLDLSAFDSAEELASLGLDRYVASVHIRYRTVLVP